MDIEFFCKAKVKGGQIFGIRSLFLEGKRRTSYKNYKISSGLSEVKFRRGAGALACLAIAGVSNEFQTIFSNSFLLVQTMQIISNIWIWNVCITNSWIRT